MNNVFSRSAAVLKKELHFRENNGAVDSAIQEIFQLAGGIHHPDIIREIILTALKAGQENPDMVDLKLMNSTIKEIRYTSKVFNPYKHSRKITVFGSARTKPGEPIYQMARDFGARLAENGYMAITEGGPGIMQAFNEGAGPENSFGINIHLPFEQKSNHVLAGTSRNIVYKYFFNRKVAFIRHADGVVLFPGGFGTLDEGMEILTLLQTGKCTPLPLIFVEGPEGDYWNAWIRFVESVLLPRDLISKNDLSLFERVGSVDDAIQIIERFYWRYHSLRYVGEKTVLRLLSDVSSQRVRMLKQQYSDLLIPEGDIQLSKSLPEERDEPGLSHLTRIVMDFNKKDFGRLRQMINTVNHV